MPRLAGRIARGAANRAAPENVPLWQIYGITASDCGLQTGRACHRLRTACIWGGSLMNRDEILKTADEERVRFMRLQFTDIMGVIKNVEIPRSQFEKALDGQIMFDGSSIEGFTRIEESDMNLVPDLDSFAIYPWAHNGGEKVARLICDIYNPDSTA